MFWVRRSWHPGREAEPRRSEGPTLDFLRNPNPLRRCSGSEGHDIWVVGAEPRRSEDQALDFLRNPNPLRRCSRSKVVTSGSWGEAPKVRRWMSFSEIRILFVDVPGPKVMASGSWGGAEGPKVRRWTFSEIQILFVDVPGPKVMASGSWSGAPEVRGSGVGLSQKSKSSSSMFRVRRS